MEQLPTHENFLANEKRIQDFSNFLGKISTVAELFDDGEQGGDREPRVPNPDPPNSSVAKRPHGYFAPVFELYPNNPFAEQKKVMQKVLVYP
jgi:hypothetical protein